MDRYKFGSIFSTEIESYIQYKISAGYNGENCRKSLVGFDKFCVEQHLQEPVFTTYHASLWLEKKNNESNSTHYRRINTSKQFLQYLFLNGYDVYVIRDVKYKETNFQPYIYSETDTYKYFLAVDSYSSNKNHKDAIQYPVIFRILYCCGTRINETLGIRKKDVDLDKGIILLNETKNDKQRYIVLGADLLHLINEFANKCFYLLNDNDYIFTNANGGRIDKKTIYERHREFLLKAGIPFLGDRKGPRLHDWRHHMAIYSFKQMVDSGLDMYVALPILSTYLGHKTIFATEKYIRLTMQLFPYINDKLADKANLVFGNVKFEEGD